MIRLVRVGVLVAFALVVVLFRKTIKNLFMKHVKPTAGKVVSAFQTGL